MNISYYTPYFWNIFFLLLVFFTLASTILAFITIMNALRLRNVKLTWNSGRLAGYPLFSTVFLFFSLGLLLLAWYNGQNNVYKTLACYNWMGLTWFTASYLMSKRYITDHGIVKNINDPSQTIAWNRISDFVSRTESVTRKDQHNYLFLYMVEQMPPCQNECQKQCIRLDLDVPRKKQQVFQKILTQKLGRRFNCDLANVDSMEQFKRL